jgi:hypothetical protein
MVQGENLSDAGCRGQRHGSRGSMSDMISVLHQSVAINECCQMGRLLIKVGCH